MIFNPPMPMKSSHRTISDKSNPVGAAIIEYPICDRDAIKNIALVLDTHNVRDGSSFLNLSNRNIGETHVFNFPLGLQAGQRPNTIQKRHPRINPMQLIKINA